MELGKVWLSLDHLEEVQISHHSGSSEVLFNNSILLGTIDVKDATEGVGRLNTDGVLHKSEVNLTK